MILITQEDPYIMLDQPTACTTTKGSLCQMVADSELGPASKLHKQRKSQYLIGQILDIYATAEMIYCLMSSCACFDAAPPSWCKHHRGDEKSKLNQIQMLLRFLC